MNALPDAYSLVWGSFPLFRGVVLCLNFHRKCDSLRIVDKDRVLAQPHSRNDNEESQGLDDVCHAHCHLYFPTNREREKMAQRISKPHLVDFLRMCDKNRWCTPRIRYASIRSKPELCHDINKHFLVEGKRILAVTPRRPIPHFPRLDYNLETRKFLVEGVPHDFPRISRQKPQFQLERRSVTLQFGSLYTRPGSGIASVCALGFPSPG